MEPIDNKTLSKVERGKQGGHWRTRPTHKRARRAGRRRVAGAVEAHVAWWRARTRKRRLVVERAEADGLARAKVLRILDELGQA